MIYIQCYIIGTWPSEASKGLQSVLQEGTKREQLQDHFAGFAYEDGLTDSLSCMPPCRNGGKGGGASRVVCNGHVGCLGQSNLGGIPMQDELCLRIYIQ